jgi:outer membrane protein OmpA-like peptidoglycan-associated protein
MRKRGRTTLHQGRANTLNWRRQFGVIVCLICFVLSSCATSREHHSYQNVTAMQQGIVAGTAIGVSAGAFAASASMVPVVAAMGGIFGGAIANYIARHQTLYAHLNQGGVKIYQVGDEYRMILSSDHFFYERTPLLNTGYYKTLNDIATFLNGLEKIEIEVAGYTDAEGPEWRDVALSRQQAHSIAKYLWARGIDTRLMYETGFGSADPVAPNDTADGRELNRRVEIRFRVLPT